MFFQFNNAKKVEDKFSTFLSSTPRHSNFLHGINEMGKINSKKTPRAKVIVAIWTETIYAICLQRNNLVLIRLNAY